MREQNGTHSQEVGGAPGGDRKPVHESAMGSGSVQWVNPSKINLQYAPPSPEAGRAMLKRGGEVLEGDWDLDVRGEFLESRVYRGLEDRFIRRLPWKKTRYYAHARDRIERDIGLGRIARPEANAELQRRLAALDALYEQISTHGYRTQTDLTSAGLSKSEKDEIRVAIGRTGRYIGVDGRHRLAIARLLGLEGVPVFVVARHSEWDAFRASLLDKASQKEGLYQEIDHPDLRDIPAHHGQERLPLVRAAFDRYDPRGKRLLDIGADWGYWSQKLSELGFRCTAVEVLSRHAKMAERLRDATESDFAVWNGDVFDYPDVESQDVVLALNIFHHLIKTETLHDRLIRFLGRVNADIMVFESHNPGAAQMNGAFRNYQPREFAEFVARHARFRSIEYLGEARGGRKLFKLSRGRWPWKPWLRH